MNMIERFDGRFSDIVRDLLEDDYLKSDRMTLSDLERKAAVKYTRGCAELGIGPGPMGRKAAEGVIERCLPHSDVVKRRLGAKIARKVQLQASRFQKIEYAYGGSEAATAPERRTRHDVTHSELAGPRRAGVRPACDDRAVPDPGEAAGGPVTAPRARRFEWPLSDPFPGACAMYHLLDA